MLLEMSVHTEAHHSRSSQHWSSCVIDLEFAAFRRVALEFPCRSASTGPASCSQPGPGHIASTFHNLSRDSEARRYCPVLSQELD